MKKYTIIHFNWKIIAPLLMILVVTSYVVWYQYSSSWYQSETYYSKKSIWSQTIKGRWTSNKMTFYDTIALQLIVAIPIILYGKSKLIIEIKDGTLILIQNKETVDFQLKLIKNIKIVESKKENYLKLYHSQGEFVFAHGIKKTKLIEVQEMIINSLLRTTGVL